ERLVPAIRSVLQEAIEAGGSSLRDFAGADGEMGYFQHRFEVYGRGGEACLRGGCAGGVRRIVQSGRSSFYCPTCQL
ncbi:MAG: zinc finger domain-containing protein, partial [Pseudomonadota bacterium]